MSEEQSQQKLPFKPYVPYQSGLPKESVDILKNWLYENRYHPYASHEERVQLAKMTNLTMQQIIDWLGNARRKMLPKWIREEGKDPSDYTIKGKRTKMAEKGYQALKEEETETTVSEATKQDREEAGCSFSVPVKPIEAAVPEQFEDLGMLMETACAKSVTAAENQRMEDAKFRNLRILSKTAVALQQYEANKGI